MKYSEDILNEIRNRLDIVELISEYISLKPSGRGYKGLCPFHQEKTPSFMVDSQRQIFHCFGCGEGGNLFSFIMKMEKVNFPEAVKLLAEKTGLELPSYNNRDNQSYREKEIILQLNEIAVKYYQDNIFSQRGKIALQYLTKRHFGRDVIQKYRLGYALPGYDNLIKILLKKKYNLQDILKAGLAVKSKSTGNIVDYFRNRIIFPITNLQGKIIAFGGRVLDNSLPKYINSPETEVYKKSNNLYGLFQAKNAIRKNNKLIIMEGYTDVIIVSQFDFENVVASLGTALTEQQIYLIKRFADEVLIAFDADNAGRSATLRSLSMLKKVDLKIKIMSFPLNHDPADIILKKGKEYFNYLIENALPLIDYKLSLLMKKYNPKKDDAKVTILKNLYPDLSEIKSQVELQIEIKKIAEHLAIDENAILKDIQKYKKSGKSPDILPKKISEFTYVNAEKIMIGSMIQNKNYLSKILKEVDINNFTVKEHQDIFHVIKKLYQNNEIISSQEIFDELNDQNLINLLSEILMKEVVSVDDETVERSINAIKKHNLQLELNRLKKTIKEKEVLKKEIEPELLKNYQSLLLKIKTII